MSNKILTILAVLSTLCFLALVTLQVLELFYFKSPPSVWLMGS